MNINTGMITANQSNLSPAQISNIAELFFFDSEQQKKDFLAMAPDQQQKIAKEIVDFAKNKIQEQQNAAGFNENEAKTQQTQAGLAQIEGAKQEAKTAQLDEAERLKALLAEKDAALSKANRTIKSQEKDMQAMSQIELGPKNIAKLLMLKRQQDKMDYFLKKDPMGGMIYIYNSGMIGVRHLKRAIHGKKFMFGLLTFREDPSKVKTQFEAYIAKLKSEAQTPKQKAIVNQLAEKVKMINDKYVDMYNKKRGPQKFNQ